MPWAIFWEVDTLEEWFPAEYFDGLSPLSRKGFLQTRPDRLSFKWQNEDGTTGTIDFSYAEITDISDVRGTTRVQLHSPDEKSDGRLLVFQEPRIRDIIRAHWVHNSSGVKKAALQVGGLSYKKKLLLTLSLLPLTAFIYYLGLYESYRVTPLTMDAKLGSMAAQYFAKDAKFCENPGLTRVMKRLTAELSPPDGRFKYHVKIIKDPLRNAFALPGGHIYFFSGLLGKSKSAGEVAGVLAHEISHVEKRHGMRQLIRILGFAFISSLLIGGGLEEVEMAETLGEIGSTLVMLKYSRAFEKEADVYAVHLMREARISIGPFIGFFEALTTERLDIMDELRKLKEKFGKKKEKEANGNNKKQKQNNSKRKGDKENGSEKDSVQPTSWFSTHPPDQSRIRYLKEMLKKEKYRERRLLKRGENWKKLKKSCS